MIASGNPLAGHVATRFQSLVEAASRAAGRQLLGKFLHASRNVLAAASVEITEEAYGRLKQRLYALTEGPPQATFEQQKSELGLLLKTLRSNGRLEKGAARIALAQAGTPPPVAAELPPATPADPLAPHRLREEEVERTRPGRRLYEGPFDPGEHGFSSRPRTPNDDPRDAPPPTLWGEDFDGPRYYFRWTTIEWRPFIRPDKHSLWCHRPIRALDTSDPTDGDRTKVVELPGGYILHRAVPKAKQLQHVVNAWNEEVEQYWPEWGVKAHLVPTGEHTWVYAAIVHTSDTDDPNPLWVTLRERLEEELDRERTREKLEELIEDGIDEILGDVDFFGLNVGAAAAGASKLMASGLIEFARWILEELEPGEAFQEIVVVHKTMDPGRTPGKPTSIVTWGTRDPASGETQPINPECAWDQGNAGGHGLNRYPAFLAQHRIDTPGMAWDGESVIPRHLPSETSHGFLLPSAQDRAIYWPPDYQWGGHVFVPVRALRGNALYCLALRTEVRATHARKRGS